MVLRIRKNPHSESFMELLPMYHGYLMNLLSLPAPKMEPIKLEANFVNVLLQSCDYLRPEHRKQVKHPESNQYWALLMPSLVDHDSYTCEIKPKWSGRKHLKKKSASVCGCRFCEAQLRKGRREGDEKDSLYCPKLLFSRNPTLVKEAVEGLFAKPSNQLRVFKGGHLVSNGPEELINMLTDVIVKSEVIQNYLELQNDLLEVIDAPETSVLQYKRDLSSLSASPPISSLAPYLRLLLAMSLRDCSFMISNSTIHLIDLDIKPIAKLQYYYAEVSLHG